MQVGFNLKGIKISRDQKWSFVAVALTVAVAIFTFFWGNSYYKQIKYDNAVIERLQEVKNKLNAEEADLATLEASFEQFDNNHTLGPDSVDDSRIVLRALPTEYDSLILNNTLNNFFTATERTYEGSVKLPDILPATVESSDGPRAVPFTMNVNSLYTSCNFGRPCISEFFTDLDRMILPIKVNKITMTLEDLDNPEGSVNLQLDMELYIQPPVELQIFDESTVRVEDTQ